MDVVFKSGTTVWLGDEMACATLMTSCAPTRQRMPKRSRLSSHATAVQGGADELLAAALWCIKCEQWLPQAKFCQKTVGRGFYTCTACKNKHASERRRTDPAARLLSRLRIRARRAGVPLKVGVHEVRQLLAAEGDPRYIAEDLVALKPRRAGEPFSADNLQLVRLGRIICQLSPEEEDQELRGEAPAARTA